MEDRPFTLIALGDCNTSGVAAAAGQTVPALVAAGLTENSAATCTMVNLGFTMSTTREGRAKLRDDTGPVDLLLVNYGLVDSWTTSLPGIYLAYYPDNFLKSLGRRLLKSVKRQLRRPALRQWVPVGEVVPLPEYEANLRALIADARQRSPHAGVVLWGTVPVRDQPARSVMIERYNAAMKSVAETSSDVLYCDTAEVVSRLDPDQVYLDDVHLSPRAAGHIASAILDLWRTRNQQRAGGAAAADMIPTTALPRASSTERRRAA